MLPNTATPGTEPGPPHSHQRRFPAGFGAEAAGPMTEKLSNTAIRTVPAKSGTPGQPGGLGPRHPVNPVDPACPRPPLPGSKTPPGRRRSRQYLSALLHTGKLNRKRAEDFAGRACQVWVLSRSTVQANVTPALPGNHSRPFAFIRGSSNKSKVYSNVAD